MNKKGRIAAGIGGNYEVILEDGLSVTVKARGLFRKQKITPMPGDLVEVSEEGFIETIYPRKNESVRPMAANIDQLLAVFAVRYPAPHFKLLDRFLVEAEVRQIPVKIVLNKADLEESQPGPDIQAVMKAYRNIGYEVFHLSALHPEETAEDFEKLSASLEGKLTVLAGPSGVGKSSLINALTGRQEEVGELSEKIERGKNTTRHARLLRTEGGGFIADTPGFSTFYQQPMEPEKLQLYFPEFAPYLGTCQFTDCLHEHEPYCAVREAVTEGQISKSRYRSYLALLEECRNETKF